MLSPSIDVPMKPGFRYCNLVMFADSKSKETPMIAPYVYKTRLIKEGKNNLKHWMLVNSLFQEAYLLIKNFSDVGEDKTE